jgi:Zn-dependent protease
MPATVLNPEPAPPIAVHNCPSCSHWLPEGTLACPDCQTLAYGQHLSELAHSATQLEQEQKWVEARERWKSALQWLPGETRQAASIQQHVTAIDQRLKAQEDTTAKWKKRLGPFAPIALFVIKFKSYVFLLFKLKFLFSLFAFFGVYWALAGWKFAVGFTACLFIHEMGHYITARRMGLKAELPIFLPGFGAYVRWYNAGVSLEQLSKIALAGPIYGLVAALGCYALALQMRSLPLMIIANVGAWINLLNLTPVFGLDGSQATYALSRMQRGLIAGTCVIFFLLTYTGDIGSEGNHWLFLIVAAGMVWRLFTNDAPKEPNTKTFGYFQALVIALGLLLVKTQIPGLR